MPDDEITLESNSENKMLIRIPPEYMPMIMGKTRKKLDRISRQTGIQIEIVPIS
jgi:predicted PilT family ATPase